ncbi:MAG: DNA/RNA non-specific endonuclease [Ignavibacteriales bacterium]|nr:DNA/RNA non-specific endonuclease [Ignavibacteriales bacterium]
MINTIVNFKTTMLFLLIVVIISCNEKKAIPSNPIAKMRYELPEIYVDDEIVEHYAYVLNYKEEFEQPTWVAYVLTSDKLIKRANRSNGFKPDPDVTTGSATPEDYKDSGYDRGHLAPAADMVWSDVAMSESFLMSNMSPQEPSFNRGIWKKLEEMVRSFVMKYEIVYIATGPMLERGLPTIGTNHVAIPKYYYKVLCVYQGLIKLGIGFILPNQSSQKTIEDYAVSIDSVEKITKINFFYSIPKNIQDKLESNFNLKQWFN